VERVESLERSEEHLTEMDTRMTVLMTEKAQLEQQLHYTDVALKKAQEVSFLFFLFLLPLFLFLSFSFFFSGTTSFT
jgi:hypothetical protein